MAENMVSGSSMRPGDVLTMYGGKTVEVLNTDAEGRLVLADALVMATEAKPDVVLDAATLTGHMVLALGERVGGVIGTDDVVDDVLAAGTRAGEAHWPMPIPEEMDERIRSSKVADLLAARLDPLGRRPVRRRVPARVHRRPALGAPRHRRPGLQLRQPDGHGPTAAPASA